MNKQDYKKLQNKSAQLVEEFGASRKGDNDDSGILVFTCRGSETYVGTSGIGFDIIVAIANAMQENSLFETAIRKAAATVENFKKKQLLGKT